MIDQPVPVDGAVLRVVLHGPGGTLAPILALHDLGGTARRWDAVAGRLAALGHPVAAVDLRGHGASPGPAVDLGVLAADVAAVAAHLGWWPVVVGHGLGAAVALRLAVDRPDVSRAQVWVAGGTTELAGRYADWPTAVAVETPPLRPGDDAARFERLLRARHPDWEEAAVAGALADAELLADGTLRPWLTAEDHQAYLSALWDQRPRNLYPGVQTPVVIVPADASDGVSRSRWALVETAEVDAAEAALLRVRVERIAGDHDLPSDRPDEVAGAIARAAIDPPGT